MRLTLRTLPTVRSAKSHLHLTEGAFARTHYAKVEHLGQHSSAIALVRHAVAKRAPTRSEVKYYRFRAISPMEGSHDARGWFHSLVCSDVLTRSGTQVLGANEAPKPPPGSPCTLPKRGVPPLFIYPCVHKAFATTRGGEIRLNPRFAPRVHAQYYKYLKPKKQKWRVLRGLDMFIGQRFVCFVRDGEAHHMEWQDACARQALRQCRLAFGEHSRACLFN